jgi:hypothetical protein
LFSQVKFEKVSFAPDVLKTLIDTSPVLFNRRFAP